MANVAARRAAWGLAALAALALAAAWLHFDLGRLLSLEQLQASRDTLQAAVQAQPVRAGLAFFALYVAVATLSIPGATVLTLAAGALFGFWVGVLLVSFASALGALGAFTAARFLLRDAVRRRFGATLAAVDDGLRRDGAFYLLTLRLVPVFPYFLVNLLMGLTPMGAARYYGVSQLGMLPATLVYVNAGTQLAALRSLQDVLSPALFGSLVLLGLLPLAAKALIAALQRRRLYARWPRPARFERNLVVIGAGAGGLVTSYIAAAAKARVTLVEAGAMGGDCLNTGCVPSKALIASARAARQLRDAEGLGLRDVSGRVDFAAVMARVQRVVQDIAPHDSVERYTALGVEVLQGRATLTSPWTVEVALADGTRRTLSTRRIVIATGAEPAVPQLPGLREAGFLTSETLWQLQALPARLLVLGGGPIGCELAQAFARLGAQVTLVEQAPRLLLREDAEAAALVDAALRADGVRVLAGHRALRVDGAGNAKRLVVQTPDGEEAIGFDEILVAVGRRARVSGFGLEALGLELTPQGTLRTDAALRTSLPNIFAVGDVAGPWQLTHAAAHQAWTAAVNALFGGLKTFAVDTRVMPAVTFTEPEVARVGMTEDEARAQGLAVEVTRYGLDDLDRAIADGQAHGFVKLLTEPGRDRLLGATVVGAQAGELLAPFTLALKHRLGLRKLLGTVHPYPTMSEAAKLAAGVWQRAHAPAGLLRWSERYLAWLRS